MAAWLKVLRQGREAGVLSAEHFGWDVESTWLKGNASNHSMCFKAFGLLAFWPCHGCGEFNLGAHKIGPNNPDAMSRGRAQGPTLASVFAPPKRKVAELSKADAVRQVAPSKHLLADRQAVHEGCPTTLGEDAIDAGPLPSLQNEAI